MFTPDKFLAVLPIIGKAYLGIFIVTALIVAVVYLLSALTRPRKTRDEVPSEEKR